MKKSARQLQREIDESLAHGWEEEIREMEREIAHKRRLVSNLATSRDAEDRAGVPRVEAQIVALVSKIEALRSRIMKR